MHDEKLYSTGKAAELLSVSFITIKRWIYAGKIKVIKMPTKQYRIPESEIQRLLGKPAPKNKAIIYARVSSADQKENLKRQREILQEYAQKKSTKLLRASKT